MISRLNGILLEKQAPSILIEVNGIGYEVQVPLGTFYQLPEIGNNLLLYTHFIVREDGHFLYGFMNKQERQLFRDLIKINGVGPKLALTILSRITPDEFVQCITMNDLDTLIRLPGIGRKTAERLMIEMRGYVTDSLSIVNPNVRDAINALIALGYKPQEAQKALDPYKNKHLSCEELLRSALKNFNAK